jgi:hypothetical protein
MLVVGKPQPGRANIMVQKGSGQNCSGEVVEGCSRGPQTNAKISAFLAGDSAGW